MSSSSFAFFGLLQVLSALTDEDETETSKPVPLEGVEVHAICLDLLCEVTLIQHYLIQSNEPQAEVMYVFPMDANAAVVAFSAQVEDGSEIHAEIRKKEDAEEVYKTEVAAGNRAYLLEQETRDIFKIRLGNMPTGKRVKVTMKYISELNCENLGKTTQFVLPLHVAPRYSLDLGREIFKGNTNAGNLSMGLSLDLQFQTKETIANIESPSHPISVRNLDVVENGASGAQVGLAAEVQVLEKDLVIQFHLDSVGPARGVVEVLDNTTCAALTFIPEIYNDDLEQKELEFIFIVDNSGSMGGQKIEQTRKAMHLFLRSLPETSAFNVIAFGSTFETWQDQSVAYSQESLHSASEFVDRMDAHLGGTEVLKPIEWLIKQRTFFEDRVVFFLTDGEVYPPERVVDVVSKNSSNTRWFTLGIGYDCSRYEVQGMARVGRGVAQFVTDEQDIQHNVVHLLATSLKHTFEVKEVRFYGNNLPGNVQFSPFHGSKNPAMYSGNTFLAYYISDTLDAPSGCEITMTSVVDGREKTFQVSLLRTPVIGEVKGFVHALGARSTIRTLEEDVEAENEQEIERIALKYGLVSSRTSFVAVDKNAETLKLRRIPSPSPSALMATTAARRSAPVQGLAYKSARTSFATMSSAARGSKPTKAARSAGGRSGRGKARGIIGPMEAHSKGKRKSKEEGVDDSTSKAVSKRFRTRSPDGYTLSSEEEEDWKLENAFQSLVRLQKFDGSYGFDDLYVVLGESSNLISHEGQKRGMNLDVWATVLVMALLEIKFLEKKNRWKLMQEKSNKWLSKRFDHDRDRKSALEFAKRTLKQHSLQI